MSDKADRTVTTQGITSDMLLLTPFTVTRFAM